MSLLFLCQTVVADFSLNTEFQLGSRGNHHGIAFDGVNWHIAASFTNIFRNYDSTFTFISDTTVAGVDDMRGLAYDSTMGGFFVGDQRAGVVRIVNADGTESSQFLTSSGLNAIAYDAVGDSIWLAHFSGLVENRTRAGSLISSFVGGQRWTGLAYDDFNDTLLLLETDDDTLFEYQTDGTLLGEIVSNDMVTGNGQGLAYDSSLGRLWVTSQNGRVAIWDDSSRAVPEPSGKTTILLGATLLSIIVSLRSQQ